MTKTSILCYEKNGGSCRNKVSPANNFVCGARHGGGAIGLANSQFFDKFDRKPKATALSKINSFQKLKLAEDSLTSPEVLDLLAGDEEWVTREIVANHISTLPKTLDKLARDEEGYVREAVANNSSTSPETHIFLAQEGHIPYGFVKGKSIDELIRDVHLVDQYPDTFGMAYLSRLLERSLQEDASHPKRRALIGYVYAKFAESEADSYNKQRCKDHIKALFSDDQEMAEIAGF